ncbi:Uncharacterised protein [Candidatus Gugararchaeum adminiculabundum]|nr:Uncharacterised protein [Candidatus Gugararchaeum adminiculabundum]
MNNKIVAVAFAMVLTLFVGTALAMPSFGRGMEREHEAEDAAIDVASSGQIGAEQNETEVERVNASDIIEQFKLAVINGDYQAAMQLHETYGVGGGMFGKLNETTFAKYAQIYVMTNELMTQMGMGGPGIGEPAFGSERWSEPGFRHRSAPPAGRDRFTLVYQKTTSK